MMRVCSQQIPCHLRDEANSFAFGIFLYNLVIISTFLLRHCERNYSYTFYTTARFDDILVHIQFLLWFNKNYSYPERVAPQHL